MLFFTLFPCLGITDEEIREKALAKTEEMELEETVQFVEAKKRQGRGPQSSLVPVSWQVQE